MRYLIIGLGIYGSNLAIDLTAMGHEVIGADSNASIVEAIKDRISTVYTIDSTEEAALSVLPLKSVDLVIVAIGENFGASIKTVAMLRKSGVRHIYARAVDEIHQTILEGFGVDRILVPEQRAARELTREQALGPGIDSMRIDDDHYVVKFRTPEFFVGMTVGEADFEGRFGMRLIALGRHSSKRNKIGFTTNVVSLLPSVGPDTAIEKDDEMTMLCTQRQFRAMLSHIGA